MDGGHSRYISVEDTDEDHSRYGFQYITWMEIKADLAFSRGYKWGS